MFKAEPIRQEGQYGLFQGLVDTTCLFITQMPLAVDKIIRGQGIRTLVIPVGMGQVLDDNIIDPQPDHLVLQVCRSSLGTIPQVLSDHHQTGVMYFRYTSLNEGTSSRQMFQVKRHTPTKTTLPRSSQLSGDV